MREHRATRADAQFLAPATEGDPDAFWALVEPHDRALRALAYRLVGDRDLMDDALQDAYLKAFRALPSFRGGSTVATWLYRIVYNACLDHLRQEGRTDHLPLDDTDERPGGDPDPADVAVGKHDLAAALASLPPDVRAAVLLVDAEGMSYAQAAEILGIPDGTVGSRLNRARRLLRRALGDEQNGTEER